MTTEIVAFVETLCCSRQIHGDLVSGAGENRTPVREAGDDRATTIPEAEP